MDLARVHRLASPLQRGGGFRLCVAVRTEPAFGCRAHPSVGGMGYDSRRCDGRARCVQFAFRRALARSRVPFPDGCHIHAAGLSLRAEPAEQSVVGPEHQRPPRRGIRADRVVGQGAIPDRAGRHQRVRMQHPSLDVGRRRMDGPGAAWPCPVWSSDHCCGRRCDGRAFWRHAQLGHPQPR